MFAALALPSAVAECDGIQLQPFVLVTADTPAGKFYVYFDGGCDPACHAPDWWILQESNGLAGMQHNEFFGHGIERCFARIGDTVIL